MATHTSWVPHMAKPLGLGSGLLGTFTLDILGLEHLSACSQL